MAGGAFGDPMLGPYAAHREFAAPARGTSELPRLILGIILIEAIYAGLLHLSDAAIAFLPAELSEGYYYGTTRLGLIAQLASFALLGMAVVVTARLLHQRGLISLLGAPYGWRQMGQVTLAVLGLFAVTDLLPPYWSTEGMMLSAPASWIGLLPVSLAALAIQIGAEEIFYRGYVQQQLAARFNSPWVWMILPNLLFASAHYDDAAPLADSAQYLIWAFFFGLAASDLTARTGNLGAAMGFHLANNIYAFMLFGDLGAEDSGLALFLFDVPPELGSTDPVVDVWLSPAFVVELSFVLLMWLAARLVLRR